MHERFSDFYNWYLNRNKKEEKLLLKEGLIRSYPITSLIEHLKEKQFLNIEIADNGLILVDNIKKSQRKRLDEILDLYGYFIADEEPDSKELDMFAVALEPKFPAELPIDIAKKTKYIYHITTDKYLEKIKNIGLVPKKSSRQFFKYPNRIYFILTDETKHDLPLLKQMLKIDNNRKPVNPKSNFPNMKNIKYHVLRIPFNDIANDLVFYLDTRLPMGENIKGMGIFTLGNIPPNKIEILGAI